MSGRQFSSAITIYVTIYVENRFLVLDEEEDNSTYTRAIE